MTNRRITVFLRSSIGYKAVKKGKIRHDNFTFFLLFDFLSRKGIL